MRRKMCSDLTCTVCVIVFKGQLGKMLQQMALKDLIWVVATRIFLEFQPEPWGNAPI